MKKIFIVSVIFIFFTQSGWGQSLGINQTVPNSAAALDIRSIGFQGMLIPRHPGNVNASFTTLTGVNGVGMMYYDTLAQVFRYYAGSGNWYQFGGPVGGSVWNLTGNAATTAANFVGTTDLRSLRFRTNNIQRLIIDSVGSVGIGRPVLDPSGLKFQVSGEGGNANIMLLHSGGGGSYRQGSIISARTRGTLAAMSSPWAGDALGTFGMMGYDGSGFGPNGPTASVDAFATENWSAGNTGTELSFSTTPNGSNSSVERMKISQDGRIGIATGTPLSDIQISSKTHISAVDLGSEYYSLYSYNLHWNGSNLINTLGGASSFMIMGEDNANPAFSVQLYADVPANTVLNNSLLRLNFRGKGLAVNRDTPGAALHVRPISDSLGILIDAPGSGFSPLLSMSDGNGGSYLNFRAAQTMISPYTLTFPDNLPSAAGQVLSSDLNGNLSWANSVSGSGTSNYVTRWTSATSVGTGSIQDDGSYVGVNSAPSSGAARMYVVAGDVTVPAIRGESAGSTNANNISVLGLSANGTASSTGLQGLASGSPNVKAVDAWATGATAGYAYGVYSRADGTAGTLYGIYSTVSGGANRYAAAFMGGNVGIGTDAPAAALSVGESIVPYGDVSITVARDGGEAFFETYSGDMSEGLLMQSLSADGDESGIIKTLFPGASDFMAGKSNSTLYIFNRGNQPIAFETNNLTRMYITGAGNIGIGTTAPSSRFDVNGTVTVTGSASEINRTSTGDANLVPIAYGNINSNGTINTAGTTSNVSCVRNSAGNYSITITGESYYFTEYATTLTLNGGIGFITCNSLGGALLVNTYNSGATASDQAFMFVVYKK